MNLPNRLTVARLCLTVLFVIALSADFRYHGTAALVVFGLASITDYLDGEIARRYGMVTDFGKLMDPLVDKIMTAAAFVCLAPLGAFPAWVAVIVISREFIITALRLLAVSKGQLLAADTWGKHKTAWQILTVVFFLSLISYRELIPGAATEGLVGRWSTLWIYGGWSVGGVAVILTLYSGLAYLWKYRAMLEMK